MEFIVSNDTLVGGEVSIMDAGAAAAWDMFGESIVCENPF